jgi:GNAT superfamily N-acetyltransferase
MTGVGQAAYAPLEVAAIDEVCSVLGRLSEAGQQLLIEAMHIIERLLTEEGAQPGFALRAPRAGDYGWLMHRQSMLFANAYGADAAFEAFVADELAALARERDREGARCWIAEQSQAVVGGAFVAPTGERAAKLRLLYVEPEARRLGIGTQLVDQAVRFAQRAGYLTLTLPTYGLVNQGSGIFERAGFVCRSSATERRFGRALLEQQWERRLDS